MGFVPDLDLSISWLALLTNTGPPLLLSWAALTEGLRNLLDCTEPFTKASFGGTASSQSAPFRCPTESVCDGASVDVVPALPLRFLRLYFSIASASLSNIRVVIGDNVLYDIGVPELMEMGGEGTEKVLAVPADVGLYW